MEKHRRLVLTLAAAAPRSSHSADQPSDPSMLRFPRPPDPERLDAAVVALAAAPSLPALAAAAELASHSTDVEQVASQRCTVVAAACLGAGIRPAGSGGRGAGSRQGIPPHLEQRFQLRALRAAVRRARHQRDSPEYVAAHRALQRATRQARQAQRYQRALRLERQILEEHDVAGFHQARRGVRPGPPDFVLADPDATFEHFRSLLAPPLAGASSTPQGSAAAVVPRGQPAVLALLAVARQLAAPAAAALPTAAALPPAALPDEPHPLAALLPDTLDDVFQQREAPPSPLPAPLPQTAGRPWDPLCLSKQSRARLGQVGPPPVRWGGPQASTAAAGAAACCPARALALAAGLAACLAAAWCACGHTPAAAPAAPGRAAQAAPMPPTALLWLAAGAAATAAATHGTATSPLACTHPRPPSTVATLDMLAALRAQLHAPFTPEEVVQLARRTPVRKSVVGPLAPWLLRPACQHLAPLLSAEFNAWRRVSRLPLCDARSSIALVPKPGGTPASPADLRGIAVGALLAKLYAAGLERRVTDHAEAAGVHADGQFGFRRHRSTEQAILALRTVMECYRLQRRRGSSGSGSNGSGSSGSGSRQRSVQLWACFVDFKQAYDRVPREHLWAQLELLGYGGEWLQAVRALYAEVPMTVSAPGLEGRVIHATQGLKQGCPLSPTLFSLYISDFEQRVLSAAQCGMQLDLPLLAGQAVPPLLYADDMALLATSPAGLQQQLHVLQQFCAERGLTVNLSKTRVVLLAGADTEQEALDRVRRARLTYAGGSLEGTTEFKYLGVVFHCTKPLGESAAAGRASVARFAAAAFEGRCTEMGLEAARLLLQLYGQLVDSTLSYGAAVWAPGLALAAATRPVRGGSGLSAAELQHHRTLRRLLGLPTRAPIAAILAEAGEPPLYITWLVRAARFWSGVVAAPPGSLLQRVLDASLQLAADCQGVPAAQLPWAAQLQRAMTAAGVEFDPLQRQQLSPDSVRQAALGRYLERVAAAARSPGASRLHHYFVTVRPGCLSPDGFDMPAYMTEVRERHRRLGLTELRTGVHWGAEERDRLRGREARPRAERVCQHCAAAGQPGLVEDTEHILFHCVLYDDLRALHPDLFPAGQPPSTLSALLDGEPGPIASFAGACRRRGRRMAGLPP